MSEALAKRLDRDSVDPILKGKFGLVSALKDSRLAPGIVTEPSSAPSCTLRSARL
jgi:hypothetical protein